MSGYVQIWNGGDPLLEHRVVYEKHHGPIPEGFHVHHRDENPRNNDPGNLELLSPGDHKKIHSGRYRRRADGGWDKVCHTCGEPKPLSEFYPANRGTTHKRDCKACHKKIQGKRLARRKAEDPDFAERQRQCARNWYGRRKARSPEEVLGNTSATKASQSLS